MTLNFKEIIKEPKYDFLREDNHLGNNIALLALGGSHSYGTNNKDSDIDIRGCALEKPSDLIGFTAFDEVVEINTDTTIYSFNKLIKLLTSMNPNTIEILGCKPEHYLYLNEVGYQLLKNRKMFLSQRCINSFGGYAYQQLNRLNSTIANGKTTQEEKEKHILNSIKSAMLTFDSRYKEFGDGGIILNIQKSEKQNLENEIFLNINLNNYPLRDFAGVLSEMQSILNSYGKLNHRNKRRDESSLDKHAMHLIRLYLMAIDLLEKEEIITYRKDDLELLNGIRGGRYRLDDGTYHDDFFKMIEVYKNRMDYAMKNTSLPKEPDMKRIEEFTMETNRQIIKGVFNNE